MPFIRPQGGGAIVTNTTAPSMDYFRRLDGATFNSATPYGTMSPVNSAQVANSLVCGPVFTGAMSFLQDMGFQIGAVGGTPADMRIGLYTNRSPTDPFPDRLLWESGNIAGLAVGVAFATANIAVPQNALLWAANVCDTGASQQVFVMDRANEDMPTPYGYDLVSSWVGFGQFYTVFRAHPFANAFPDPWPAAGNTIGNGATSDPYQFLWRGF